MNHAPATRVYAQTAPTPAVTVSYAPAVVSAQNAATAHVMTVENPAALAKNAQYAANASYAATVRAKIAMTPDLPHVPANCAPVVASVSCAEIVTAIHAPQPRAVPVKSVRAAMNVWYAVIVTAVTAIPQAAPESSVPNAKDVASKDAVKTVYAVTSPPVTE